MNIQPRITLVGIGPGDLDLLTIKGLKAIKTADVILYDESTNTLLLNEAPDNSLKIDISRQDKKYSYSNEEINLLMVFYAYIHGHVVQLKGGNYFSSQLNSNEISFSDFFDMETTVVPGVVTDKVIAQQKIRRKICMGFWIIMKASNSNKFSKDLILAAQYSGTVIIHNGLKKLKKIVEIFTNYGKKDSIIMIVLNSYSSEGKTVLGKINNIEKLINEKEITTSSIVIIGDVLKFYSILNYERLKKISQDY